MNVVASSSNNQNGLYVKNKRMLLVRRPAGKPVVEDFRWDEEVLSYENDDWFLILENMYVSIDPAMRGWMDSNTKSYLPPVPLGSVMRASTISRVVQSQDKKSFPINSLVLVDDGGVQSHCVIPKNNKVAKKMVHLLPTNSAVPPSAFLSVLGITGLTAYFGMMKKGQPRSGNTVLVSGAAGATGSIAAQIAKIHGCTVIGTAGSDAKCQFLLENKICDHVINYKTSKSLSREIRKACSGKKGVDIVFDNVGGHFLEAALSNLNKGARIVLCGAISQYNNANMSNPIASSGPRNYMNLLVKRATMSGFVVFDYRHEYASAIQDLATWIQNKQMMYKEHFFYGVNNFFPAFSSLFNGSNNGKVILNLISSNQAPTMSKL